MAAEMNDKIVEEEKTPISAAGSCGRISGGAAAAGAANEEDAPATGQRAPGSAAAKTESPSVRLRPAARAIVLLRRAATTLLPAASSESSSLRIQSRWRRYQWQYKLRHSVDANELANAYGAAGAASTSQQRSGKPAQAESPSASSTTTTQTAFTFNETQSAAAAAAHANSFLVPKTNALKLPIVCHIKSIDGNLLCEIYVHRFELGQYLIDSLKVSLGVQDFRYFGLKLVDDVADQDDPHRAWLEPNERVLKQLAKLGHAHQSSRTRTSSSTSTLPSNCPTVASIQSAGPSLGASSQGWTLKRKLESFDEETTSGGGGGGLDQAKTAKSASLDRLNERSTVPKRVDVGSSSDDDCRRCVQMFLRIKYYPPNVPPPTPQSAFLRHYLWLQLRRDLSLGKLTSSMNNLILLMACVIQHELGDFDQELADSRVHQLNILPNQDLIEEQAIEVWRLKFKGLRQTQVQAQFLRAAIILETYGFDYYAVRDHQRQRAYLLGFNYAGIKTIRNGLIVHHFRWQSVQKVSQERRMIIFHINHQTDNSKRKQIVGFKCPSNEECRTLYLRLLEQKHFFTVDDAYTEHTKYPTSSSSLHQSPSPADSDWDRKSPFEPRNLAAESPPAAPAAYNAAELGHLPSTDTMADFNTSQPAPDVPPLDGFNQTSPLMCTDVNCTQCYPLQDQHAHASSPPQSPSVSSASRLPVAAPLDGSFGATRPLGGASDADTDVGSRARRVIFSQQRTLSTDRCDEVFYNQSHHQQTTDLSSCGLCLNRATGDAAAASAAKTQVNHSTPNHASHLQETSTMTDRRPFVGPLNRLPYHSFMVNKLRQIYQRNVPFFAAMGPFFRLCMLIVIINLLIRAIDSLSGSLWASLGGEPISAQQSVAQQSPTQQVLSS